MQKPKFNGLRKVIPDKLLESVPLFLFADLTIVIAETRSQGCAVS